MLKEKKSQKYQPKLAPATRKLFKKALKNKPKSKPAKGYKYLKDLKIGSLFETQSGIRGVLIEYGVNATVIITSSPNTKLIDDSFYLGKKIISAQTEVKEKR